MPMRQGGDSRPTMTVSEALFYTGCDTPFQGPSLGRPIFGASNQGYLLYLLIYVDF